MKSMQRLVATARVALIEIYSITFGEDSLPAECLNGSLRVKEISRIHICYIRQINQLSVIAHPKQGALRQSITQNQDAKQGIHMIMHIGQTQQDNEQKKSVYVYACVRS